MAEAEERLLHLRAHGATAYAFTLRTSFPPGPGGALPTPSPSPSLSQPPSQAAGEVRTLPELGCPV